MDMVLKTKRRFHEKSALDGNIQPIVYDMLSLHLPVMTGQQFHGCQLAEIRSKLGCGENKSQMIISGV